MKTSQIIFASLTVALLASSISPFSAKADVTSPRINNDAGRKYSKEKPIEDYYGKGQGGRMVEASELRLTVEELITDGDWEAAIPKAKKAVQLDGSDPTGHLLLVKALTMKFYANKGPVDEKLLAECLREWNMIRYHDSDPTEQWDAGNQVKKLEKISKALAKDKLRMQKERALQEAIAARKQANGDDSDDDEVAPVKVAAKAGGGTATTGAKVNVRENVKQNSVKSNDDDEDNSSSSQNSDTPKKRIFGRFF